MQNNINISNNCSFKGAFLLNFNKTLPGTREGFEKSMGKIKGQVFENFDGKNGDVLYVLRNSKDYYAANFINRNKLKFHYIPEISSNQCFEPDKPKTVINYIKKTKPRIFRKFGEMMNFIKENREECRAINGYYTCEKILNNLRIELNGKKEKDSKGITTINDGLGFLVLSPQNANGTSFAYVKPNNNYDNARRYAVDKDGNILTAFNTPNEMLEFKKQFVQSIKHHLHQD